MRRAGVVLLLALGLSACGGGEAEAPAAATQRGIDRSVADIRAAEAATREPVTVSRSVGELTGKTVEAPAADKGESRAKARAAAPAVPPAEG